MALLFAAPFFVYAHTPPVSSFYAEWLAAVIGCVYCAVFMFFAPRSGLAKFPRVAFLPLLIALLISLQMVAGIVIYPGVALLAILALLLATLTTWSIANHQRIVTSDRIVWTIAHILIIVGLLCSAISLVQLFQLETPFNVFIAWGDSDYFFANIGQKNHYATLIALALAALLFRIAGSLRWYFAVFLFPLGFALSLSGSRSIWLYLALMLVALVRLPKEFSKEKRMVTGSLLAVGISVIVSDRLLREFIPSFADGLGRISAEGFGGLGVRLAMWRDALASIVQQPLPGVGYQGGSYWHFLAQSANRDPAFSPQFDQFYLENYHNLILHLGVEFGVAGLVLGAALAGYILFVFWRIRTLRDWFLASLLGTLFCHAMLEYPLHYLYYLLIFSVLLGLTEWRHVDLTLRGGIQIALSAVIFGAGTFVSFMTFNSYRAIESVEIAARQGKLQFTAQVRTALKEASAMGFLLPYVDAVIHNIEPKHFESNTYPQALISSERAMRFRTSRKTVETHIRKLEAFGYPEEEKTLKTKAHQAYRSFSE